MEAQRDDFAEILRRVRSGDESAAAQLFAMHQPRLLRFLRALEPRVADDLAAEVWMAVVGSFDRFEGDAVDFRAWLFAIARRRVADHRRRGVRRRTDPADPTAVMAIVDALGPSDDVADTVTSGMSAQAAVDEIVRHLTPDQAEVLLLRVLGDLSVSDVAVIMDRSAPWVRVTQHRAVSRLGRRLGARLAVTE
jgi:RNA polymerase sigma-70 factor (ECF subfamily)